MRVNILVPIVIKIWSRGNLPTKRDGHDLMVCENNECSYL